MLRVSSRNARFQQFQALLGNRAKRQRAGEFLVQGVRPITLAAEYGWRFRALLADADRPLSAWATPTRSCPRRWRVRCVAVREVTFTAVLEGYDPRVECVCPSTVKASYMTLAA